MMIECEIHGLSFAVQVSPDVQEKIYSSGFIEKLITIHYEYESDIVDTFYLSEEFAGKYGFTCDATIPLPDDYPEWMHLLAIVCEKCFIEAYKGASNFNN